MAKPTVAVVTPWYQHPELIADYFKVMASDPPEQLIIVNNGGDEPLGYELLTACRNYPQPNTGRPDWWWRIIPTPRNLGFSPACNLGLHAATTDAVIFLNNDVRLKAGADLWGPWLHGLRAQLQPGR